MTSYGPCYLIWELAALFSVLCAVVAAAVIFACQTGRMSSSPSAILDTMVGPTTLLVQKGLAVLILGLE